MDRIRRKQAVSIRDVLNEMLVSSGLSAGHNIQLIFAAWDEASGAAGYTVKKFFRDGILYITLNSSAARLHLQMQKEGLVDRINSLLLADTSFIPNDPKVGLVKELKLK